ncbi:MAG: hypothetical protein Q4E74_11730 [Ruminococcus sp.]|nr:hypothetical protein [Ruminococcus sp.]
MNDYRITDIILSLISGCLAGIVPVLYPCFGTAYGSVLIPAVISLAVMSVLEYSKKPINLIMKLFAVFVSSVVWFVISRKFDWLHSIYNYVNRDYVEEYGGMNAGDGFGYMFMQPIGIVIMLVSMVISAVICGIVNFVKIKKSSGK